MLTNENTERKLREMRLCLRELLHHTTPCCEVSHDPSTRPRPPLWRGRHPIRRTVRRGSIRNPVGDVMKKFSVTIEEREIGMNGSNDGPLFIMGPKPGDILEVGSLNDLLSEVNENEIDDLDPGCHRKFVTMLRRHADRIEKLIK